MCQRYLEAHLLSNTISRIPATRLRNAASIFTDGESHKLPPLFTDLLKNIKFHSPHKE